ncbi:MAG: adenosylcobalamin-dependent ribonucleoside-diphosphate reductase [Thermoprotei archaeon]
MTELEKPNPSDSLRLPREALEFFGGDELRARVFIEKYALRNEDGEIVERTPVEMWHRVAREMAGVEPTVEKRMEWEAKFFWLLEDFRFVPGGRILFGAAQTRRSTLLNCYVIPIKEDSIEAIFEWCKEAARTYSYGGGVGTDISVLRPKGAPVHNSAIYSTGSVSFMNVMSETTGTIGQSGRRGALMITIRVDHPDIFDFIKVKRDLRTVRYANISVRVSDEFMRAVRDNAEFTLKYESDRAGKIERKVSARTLWNELITSARDWAEPGLIFWDAVKRGSPSEYNGMEVVTTNPCSEQPLQPYGACDLGNINLSAFVKDAFTANPSVDWENLERAVRYSVRFLDNVLTYNHDRHPLKAQAEASAGSRRIGVGFTGLADMFVKLGIKYDSNQALEFADELFARIKETAYDESVELAKEKGSFPLFDAQKHLSMSFIQSLKPELRDKISRHGLRNVAILTVPPVGSGSVLAGTSSGIEPIFAFSYTRRSESLSKERFKVYHPVVKEYMERFGVDDEQRLPDFFVPAHKIEAEFRVRMQATIQKHIDSAISSTVNLPSDASVEDVSRIYFQAWEAGCKGITVYREGSREGILITENAENVASGRKQEPEERPKVLWGQTIKMRLPQGWIYVTVNKDHQGRVKEVFVNLGKSGSDEKTYSEALGRLISNFLQAGGDVDTVIHSLKGIQGKNAAWDRGMHLLSVPDAIAQAIELAVGKTPAHGEKDNASPPKQAIGETCPNCGEKTLINENGCLNCKTCGYSKCE